MGSTKEIDEPSDKPEIVFREYFHIGNGGVTLSLIDSLEKGPQISVGFDSFGAVNMEFSFCVSESDILDTCEAILSAVRNKEFNEPHVNHGYRVDDEGNVINRTEKVPLSRVKGRDGDIRNFIDGNEDDE